MSQSPHNLVHARRVDPTVLAFSLSLHWHIYICILFSSRFISLHNNSKQLQSCWMSAEYRDARQRRKWPRARSMVQDHRVAWCDSASPQGWTLSTVCETVKEGLSWLKTNCSFSEKCDITGVFLEVRGQSDTVTEVRYPYSVHYLFDSLRCPFQHDRPVSLPCTPDGLRVIV